jgi:hypothetical protein
MGGHPPSVLAQRSHWYEKRSGRVPRQDPVETVSVRETRARPERVGRAVLRGTTAPGAEDAGAGAVPPIGPIVAE